MVTVLFACVHNAGRSQMAAAWFNRLADPSKALALSAGTSPGPAVHPEVVAAMREKGIDLSSAVPRVLDEALAATCNWLITMGCQEHCPVVAGVRRADWPIRDPNGLPLPEVRNIRDEVEFRVRGFLEEHGWLGLRDE